MHEHPASQHLRAFLLALGLPEGQATDDAARRATELFASWTRAAREPATPPLSAFPADEPGDWIAVRSMPFYSLCEHHLVPFFGVAEVVYLPRASIVGFSSITRLLDHLARRPQLQERLAAQLADALHDALEPAAVLVRLRARQLCVEMRGFGAGVECTSTAARGLCRETEHAQHALALLGDPR